MTWEIGFMLVLLVVILAAFVWEKIPSELTAMSAFALLLVLGLLAPKEAMGVFSNSAPIAVGAMFILSAALEKCGAIDLIAGGLAKLPPMKLWMVMPILLIGVGSISAFINNTPVVVVFLPVVLSLARRIQVSPSKLLIPLSYGAILGGTCTVVGTSTATWRPPCTALNVARIATSVLPKPTSPQINRSMGRVRSMSCFVSSIARS